MKQKTQFRQGLELFAIFFKMGMFTFGSGWSILAQVEQEFVRKRKNLTAEELLDLTAVGKSLPGIMIANVSMLFGYELAGWFGGLCAVVGLTLPAILILTVVTYFYDRIKDNAWFGYALRGISGAVVAIITSAAWTLGREGLKKWYSFGICLIALLVSLLTGLSKVLIIVLGVACALLWFGIDRARQPRGGKEEDQ